MKLMMKKIIKLLTFPIWGTILLLITLIWIFSPITEREKIEIEARKKNTESESE